MILGKNYGVLVDVIPFVTTIQNLYSREEKEKIDQLKAQKRVKIYFESERFIIYTYKVENIEISVNFNTKHLVEWSKEQLKGVLVE